MPKSACWSITMVLVTALTSFCPRAPALSGPSCAGLFFGPTKVSSRPCKRQSIYWAFLENFRDPSGRCVGGVVGGVGGVWGVIRGRFAGDDGEDLLAILGELGVPDAVDAEQSGAITGLHLGDGLKGEVGEDHVGGDLLLPGPFHPPAPQRLEELLVVGGRAVLAPADLAFGRAGQRLAALAAVRDRVALAARRGLGRHPVRGARRAETGEEARRLAGGAGARRAGEGPGDGELSAGTG